jgi:hypothetical protein
MITVASQRVLVVSTTCSSHIDSHDLFGVSSDLYRAAFDEGASLQRSHRTIDYPPKQRNQRAIINNRTEQDGKWFFVAYIVVSFAAGFKELGSKFNNGEFVKSGVKPNRVYTDLSRVLLRSCNCTC